jgi:hypothetical protein
MTSYKRIDGDYYIQTIDPPTQKVYIDTDTTVSGNLTVQGNLTYINVEELNVKDPFILVNASNTSTYAANSGLMTHTSNSTYAGIRYNITSGQWQLNTNTADPQGNDPTGWTPISTGNTVVPGGSNTAVQFNNGDGTFGGNANLTFDRATSRLTLTGTAALAYQSAPPTSVANTATMVANTPGSGGTGIYFTNGSDQDELISKSKAIVFSIIF